MSGCTAGQAVRGAVVLTLVGLLCACQGPPQTVRNKCVENWPEAPAPFVPAASLPGVTPALLWTQRVSGAPPGPTMLLSGEQVLFTISSRLFGADRADGTLGYTSSVGRESVTTAVLDEQGNRYFVGYSVYSVSPSGNYRWVVPLPGHGDRPVRGRGRVVLGPEGGLFFGASDGHLYAYESSDGSLRWRVPASGEEEREPAVIGGVGDALMAFAPDSTKAPQLWDRRTGAPLAWFSDTDGERHPSMAGPTLGIVTQRFEDRGGSYPWMHISVLDRCAEPRFHIPAKRAQWPALVGPDDHLLVVTRDDQEGSPTSVTSYAPGGQVAAGPVEMPIPWAIGADGTVFALACDSPGVEGPSRLYAYTPDLTLRWMLPLGEACPMGGPMIDEQGRLFFTWYRELVTELVAVQTDSPGLAATSWPVRRRDARATGWVP